MTAPEFTYDWTTPHAANWLQWLAPIANRPGISLLTIGAAEARSEYWFLEHIATHPTATLYTIEPGRWPKDHARLFHNHQRHPAANRWITDERPRAVALLALHRGGRWFNAIYADGDHATPAAYLDLTISYQLLAPGGVLIVDDLYHPDAKTKHGPEIALALARRDWDPQPRVIIAPDARYGQAAIFAPDPNR